MEELWSKKTPPSITDINNKLKNIPENHKQEALNTILYNVIINYFTIEKKDHGGSESLIKNLIDLKAKPPVEFESVLLIATLKNKPVFMDLLNLIQTVHADVIEAIINSDFDLGEKIKLLKLGLPKMDKNEIIILDKDTDPSLIKLLENKSEISQSKVENIYLYPIPDPQVDYLKLDYPASFKRDNEEWDTMERYIMYKLYEKTPKGQAIKNSKTLEEARNYFLMKPLSYPTNTKEMVHAIDIGAIANSLMNKQNLNNKVELFYDSLYEKFNHHTLLRNMLLNSGDAEIIDKNVYSLGYEGNLLGNTLMRIRTNLKGEKEFLTHKNNNLTIKKYGTKGFYVVRGDPDEEMAVKLRTLSTFKNKAGKTIYGKLNFNLSGGPGWLIPLAHSQEAKELVYSTEPLFEQIARLGRKWIKHKLNVLLRMIQNYVKISGGTNIEAADVMLIIKDIYPCGGFLGQDFGEPNYDFIGSVKKIVGSDISDAAIKILWDFLGNMIKIGFGDINTVKEFQDKVKYYNTLLINKKVPILKGLNERESIFVSAFLKVYNVLKGIPSINPGVSTIKLLFPKEIKEIKEEYNKKSKIKGESKDELKMFKNRFKIQNPHLEAVLKALESGPQDKKNKLLILVALDYLLKPRDVQDDLEINKKLQCII